MIVFISEETMKWLQEKSSEESLVGGNFIYIDINLYVYIYIYMLFSETAIEYNERGRFYFLPTMWRKWKIEGMRGMHGHFLSQMFCLSYS